MKIWVLGLLAVLVLQGCGTARLKVRATATQAFPATWDQPVAVAPAPLGNMEFTGKRLQLKSTGTKCAAMPLQSAGIPANVALLMDEVLLSELHQAGFESIGPDDINSMLGFEKVKDAAGCNNATCIAEIGGALGVQYLVIGRIATVDGAPIVTLKLLDVRAARVLGRANQMGVQSEREIPRLLAAAVQELVQKLDSATP